MKQVASVKYNALLLLGKSFCKTSFQVGMDLEKVGMDLEKVQKQSRVCFHLCLVSLFSQVHPYLK